MNGMPEQKLNAPKSGPIGISSEIVAAGLVIGLVAGMGVDELWWGAAGGVAGVFALGPVIARILRSNFNRLRDREKGSPIAASDQ